MILCSLFHHFHLSDPPTRENSAFFKQFMQQTVGWAIISGPIRQISKLKVLHHNPDRSPFAPTFAFLGSNVTQILQPPSAPGPISKFLNGRRTVVLLYAWLLKVVTLNFKVCQSRRLKCGSGPTYQQGVNKWACLFKAVFSPATWRFAPAVSSRQDGYPVKIPIYLWDWSVAVLESW